MMLSRFEQLGRAARFRARWESLLSALRISDELGVVYVAK